VADERSRIDALRKDQVRGGQYGHLRPVPYVGDIAAAAEAEGGVRVGLAPAIDSDVELLYLLEEYIFNIKRIR
jgi:hypothetical protein